MSLINMITAKINLDTIEKSKTYEAAVRFLKEKRLVSEETDDGFEVRMEHFDYEVALSDVRELMDEVKSRFPGVVCSQDSFDEWLIVSVRPPIGNPVKDISLDDLSELADEIGLRERLEFLNLELGDETRIESPNSIRYEIVGTDGYVGLTATSDIPGVHLFVSDNPSRRPRVAVIDGVDIEGEIRKFLGAVAKAEWAQRQGLGL